MNLVYHVSESEGGRSDENQPKSQSLIVHLLIDRRIIYNLHKYCRKTAWLLVFVNAAISPLSNKIDRKAILSRYTVNKYLWSVHPCFMIFFIKYSHRTDACLSIPPRVCSQFCITDSLSKLQIRVSTDHQIFEPKGFAIHIWNWFTSGN